MSPKVLLKHVLATATGLACGGCGAPLNGRHVGTCPTVAAEVRLKRATARVTSRKYLGDDAGSWAVFLDGRPAYTGLTQREVLYYKNALIHNLIGKGVHDVTR